MAKSKALLISGPMDARHVGGVNVSSSAQPSMVESYFAKPNIEPDELPSHTFVAHGKVEVPRRSNTITSTIRRPSISIKRSLSTLRTSSIAQLSDLHHNTMVQRQNSVQAARSESTRANRPLRMQSSLSRLRQKVGLDKDVNADVSESTTPAFDFDNAPKPLPKDITYLPIRRPLSPITLPTASSKPEPEFHRTSQTPQRKPSSTRRHMSSEQKPLPAQPQDMSRPTRPKRADSGTAIDLDNVPVDERPLGFKDIQAMRSFPERMRQYERAREYWAHADHGLTEWNGNVIGSRSVMTRA
ncbi:hypothetical protein FB567DRAFT_266530 [Paraphoma chrysanthemicola]|uniref:Uncharacterized protein n=1 Tax=Paraphoma chrysanthemicola TaxID=798071 RepID=A0A8K0RES1_9PLEO|nr:hypothetical protein FB567DRAFT_266530 [Paraphoma chrysanthemicola]